MSLRPKPQAACLADLSRLSHVLKVGQCLPGDLGDAKPLVEGEGGLRGRSAVFWPNYETTDDLQDIEKGAALPSQDLYPDTKRAGKRVNVDSEYEMAQVNKEMIERNVVPTVLGASRQEDQQLFHWTNYFPGQHVLENQDGQMQVVTMGYLWTSTDSSFVWNRRTRVKIVIPKDKTVEVFVDPASHSQSIPCGPAMPSMFHRDVVLPPSAFRVEKLEGTDEELDDLAWNVLLALIEYVNVDVILDRDKWTVEFKSAIMARSFQVALRHTTRTDVAKAIHRYLPGPHELRGTVVFVGHDWTLSRPRLPVLTWVGLLEESD